MAARGQRHSQPRQTAVGDDTHHLTRMGRQGAGHARGMAQNALSVGMHVGISGRSGVGKVGQCNDQHKSCLIVERRQGVWQARSPTVQTRAKALSNLCHHVATASVPAPLWRVYAIYPSPQNSASSRCVFDPL